MKFTDVEVQWIDIELPIPYQYNSKVHTQDQIARIANSIHQFGFNAPLVLDEDNVILAGHGRFAAARRLGMKRVPIVRRIGLSETDKRMYRIVDNKTASDTTYDYGNLELEVKALEELGMKGEDFGFQEFQFPTAPVEEEKKEETTSNTDWFAKINLKVPAESIDLFESELNDLVAKYAGIIKEVKRSA